MAKHCNENMCRTKHTLVQNNRTICLCNCTVYHEALV